MPLKKCQITPQLPHFSILPVLWTATPADNV